MRHLVPLALAAALLANPGFADAPAEEEKPSIDKVGTKIEDFSLPDASGKATTLYGFKDRKAVVVVFLSFDCPVSNSYAPTLAELAKKYEGKAAFLGVHPGEVPADELAKKVEAFALPFPVLLDKDFRAADLFKADTVPSAFVLDHNFVLRYRGRIDNTYYARLRRNPRTTSHDLREALDQLLAGKPVATPATLPVGCPVARGRDVKKTGEVTYYRDVLPILQANCQGCHRPGEVGPFSLMTYDQAVNWAGDIKHYTQTRRMPPWKPVAGVAFHNERKLSDKDIATLAAWADEGTPRGDPKDAPPAREFVKGWQLGKPDLVLTVPEEMTVAASGPDLFRCFVLPTGLTEDQYVVAVEVRPGNPRVVHHTLNFWDRSGKARELEKEAQGKEKGKEVKDRGPGYSVAMGVGFRGGADEFGGLGGWAPGNLSRTLPADSGYFLPKGSDVVLQVHYHRTGRVEKDRTQIGLYFARDPKKTQQFKSMVIPGRFLLIPAGSQRYKVTGQIELLQDCELHSVMPHMHMLGKEVKVTLTQPGEGPTTLVAIDDWDYNWQETYFLKESIRLKKGAKLEVEAFYDNSENNPNNPNSPPRIVWFGEQTTDEMCFVFLGATSDEPGRIKVRRR